MEDGLGEWYLQLDQVKKYLILNDPILKDFFETVDKNGFKLYTIIKNPYTTLIGAIIGQKISYRNDRKLRSELYGTNLNPDILYKQDLSFLGIKCSTIIAEVTDFIINSNVNLNTKEGIWSLLNVKGIGQWTIETMLITSLKDWDIFPLGDKFIQTRMKRLYGINCDMKIISEKWVPYRSLVTWYLWRWF